ncbi:MAG: mandelate racemase/muconate lactonizing enzyme family protein [Acetobacteraceae bacterium]|nr:mandelate racemase/muconate lactonizing enzyme family protein [Acetobacteraceae bacterium]
MRIAAVDVFEMTVPFSDGAEKLGAPPGRWLAFETVLVRVTTADGLTGWGEAFAYGCQASVAAAVRSMVSPLLIGRDASDPAALTLDLQRKLHIFGRYGITLFAISGADIALWDLRAKAEGVSLASLVGERQRDSVPSYASLVRYGRPDLVERFAAQAVAEGYRSVKLHEIDMDAIRAGRRGAGQNTHLTVDANCAWSLEQARVLLPQFEEVQLGWLEEPLFPPEHFDALTELASGGQVAIAAGENACTRYEFARLIRSGVTFPQPSVTKVGGVTEFTAALREAASAGKTCMPHSPYFGPGYLATVQLLAVAPGEPLLETLYVTSGGIAGLRTALPCGGAMEISTGPGIGFEPDWEVFERFAVKP